MKDAFLNGKGFSACGAELPDRRIIMRNNKRIAVVAAAIVLFAAVLVYAPPLFVMLQMTGHVDFKDEPDGKNPLTGVYAAKDFDLSSNDMTLLTSDGVEIFVSEVEAESPRGAVIFLSGVELPSVTHFYPQAGWLKENGYSSFLVETRGHGKSGGSVSLGYMEPLDVSAVTDYIRSRDEYADAPITLIGFSMGGAAALAAFGGNAVVESVRAMSAYASFEDMTYYNMKKYGAPEFWARAGRWSTLQWLYVFYGGAALSRSAKESIKNADGRRVLLAASARDGTVNAENSKALYIASGKTAELWVRDSSSHFIVEGGDPKDFYADREYRERVLGFLDGED